MLGRILKKNIWWLLLATVSVFPVLYVALNSTSIIQNMGIRAFSTAKVISYVICGVGCVAAIGMIASNIIRVVAEENDKNIAKKKIEEMKNQRAIDERNAKAKLNVKGPLNDSVIYERMKYWLDEDWGRMNTTKIPELISEILRQLDDMNAYQLKLSRLLVNNGVDYLYDTNEVLESVEQNMLRKVRKVLNCFVIYETKSVQDVEKMQTLLEETKESNESQLDNVKDFLFAITDFLNKQGDNDNGAEKLDIYKRTILESITETE